MIFELVCKIMTMHGAVEVRDENGELVYQAHSKMISITEKSVITDGEDREIARYHRKVFSIHRIHTIEMVGGEVMTMKVELLHPFKDVIDVEENGWKLKGNFTSHTYQILDEEGQVLADITRPWVALHDKCRIDVKDEKNVDRLMALTIVLEHMLIERRQEAESAAGAGSVAAAGNVPQPAGGDN